MCGFLNILCNCVLGLEVYVYLQYKKKKNKQKSKNTFTSENWIWVSIIHHNISEEVKKTRRYYYQVKLVKFPWRKFFFNTKKQSNSDRWKLWNTTCAIFQLGEKAVQESYVQTQTLTVRYVGCSSGIYLKSEFREIKKGFKNSEQGSYV